MATDREEASRGIDHYAYNAAVSPGTKFNDSYLEAALASVTAGGENTLLHLAASVGNIVLVKDILRLKPLLGKAPNAQGNTALHLAAQGGFSVVVETLLQQEERGVDVRNKLNETALLKAYESGDLDTVKMLFDADPSSLWQKTVDGRTCLHVAIYRGDLDLAAHILRLPNAKDLIQEKYKNGDTALHIAVGRNDVGIIRELIKIEAQLCYSVNSKEETPLCVAVKLGHLEAVQELIKERPDAVEIAARRGMNVLHLAALVSQVRIVDYFNQNVCLLDLVNKGLDKPREEEPLESGENADPFPEISQGDTPLHIAARNKNCTMVKSLLRIPGVNTFALNNEGLTALDIVRESTQYHESREVIAVLANCTSNWRKALLNNAPKVSAEKHEVAVKMVDKTFDDRRDIELVVAVLLATMSFTAAFTVPGGFDGKGSPLLLGLDTFKLFLIFDCLAFFLSLSVVLMWQISSPITTKDKLLFLCVTKLLVCASFAFTAFGFMAAVYAMLSQKTPKLGWFLLGMCLIICCYANFSFLRELKRFCLKMMILNQPYDLLPFLPEPVREHVWKKLVRWWLWMFVHWCKSIRRDIWMFVHWRKSIGRDNTQPKSVSHRSNSNV